MVTYLLFCKIPNREPDTKHGYNPWEEENLYQFSGKTLNILSISANVPRGTEFCANSAARV